MIRDIRNYEGETDNLERELKFKIFGVIKDPLAVFHLVRLIERSWEISPITHRMRRIGCAMIEPVRVRKELLYAC
jgi:uncharacterized protein Yka (UPF0111/DUF47 family)